MLLENELNPEDFVFKIQSKHGTATLKLVEAVSYTEENRLIESALVQVLPDESEAFNDFMVTRIA